MTFNGNWRRHVFQINVPPLTNVSDAVPHENLARLWFEPSQLSMKSLPTAHDLYKDRANSSGNLELNDDHVSLRFHRVRLHILLPRNELFGNGG
jgi:hypothetical protein